MAAIQRRLETLLDENRRLRHSIEGMSRSLEFRSGMDDVRTDGTTSVKRPAGSKNRGPITS